jgi:hypothetical protein
VPCVHAVTETQTCTACVAYSLPPASNSRAHDALPQDVVIVVVHRHKAAVLPAGCAEVFENRFEAGNEQHKDFGCRGMNAFAQMNLAAYRCGLGVPFWLPCSRSPTFTGV